MLFQHLNNRNLNAISPQKLLKVQRVHINYRLSAYRNRLRLLTVTLNAQQRAGTDHIIPTIITEKLQRGTSFGTILNLIQHKDGLSWLEDGFFTQKGRKHHDDMIYFKRACENGGIVRILEKVEVDNMRIVLFGEVKYRVCFTTLSAAFNDQWLSIRSVLPLNQTKLNFSFQHEYPPRY